MSMASSYEQYILAVTTSDDDITLRIDRNSWTQSQIERAPVVEVRLTACRNLADALDALNGATGKPVYYKVMKDREKVTVTVVVNYYEPGELQIDCQQVAETLTDYTFEDLKFKTDRLTELYAANLVANELSDYIYQLSKNTLLKMIQKELDSHPRKIEFFSRKNPEKAATLTGESQAYQKVLTLMGLAEINGQAIPPQIRYVLSQIRSEEVGHQPTYAALVEGLIADMGKSALFPLLEIIKRPNSSFTRDQAIWILGLIDPEVNERVMKIVQSDNKPADR